MMGISHFWNCTQDVWRPRQVASLRMFLQKLFVFLTSGAPKPYMVNLRRRTLELLDDTPAKPCGARARSRPKQALTNP
jgi:hypothetical protein